MLTVQRSCREVVHHPCPLICPKDGYVSIDPAILLIGEMGLYLLVLSVELAIGLLELLTTGLNHMIFLGVDEGRVKEEFPKGVRIQLARKTGLGISCVDHDVTEVTIRLEVHVQEGHPITDLSFRQFVPVNDLYVAVQFQRSGIQDLRCGNDHSWHQQTFVALFHDGETCERQIMDVPLYWFLNKRMRKIGDKWRRNPQPGCARFSLL